MASFPAVGDGPIAFFDAVTGQNILVPLPSVQFSNAAGTAVTLLPPFATATYAAALNAWILYLVSAGRLSAGTGPATQLAFIATAVDKGSAGDNIKVAITYSSPTTFDITASESETYKGLTIANIKSILGTEIALGSKPGLVHVLDATITMPKTLPATALTGGGATAAAKFLVPDTAGTGTAFTLEARRVGDGGNSVKAAISDVDTVAGTFTLDVSWSNSVTGIVAADLATLNTKLAPLGFLITVSAPPGASFAMPQAASQVLGGGVDPAAAAQSFVAST
jgi:hypothetical protein